MEAGYRAQVITKGGALNLRDAPGGRVLTGIPAGSLVAVSGEGEWLCVEYEGMSGYAAAQYLVRIEQEEEKLQMVLTDEAGCSWIPQGEFRVQLRKVED